MEQHVNNTDKHITATEKLLNEKVDGGSNQSHKQQHCHITSVNGGLECQSTTAYVDGKIAALVDSLGNLRHSK